MRRSIPGTRSTLVHSVESLSYRGQICRYYFYLVQAFLPPAQRRGQVMLLSFFFLQTISSSQLLLVFYLCHHDIVTDFVHLGTPLTWRPLIPGDPSYLGTPHTWGFLLPRDSLYLGTPFTFFQSSSFFYIFHLCQHDIVIGSVWMSYFLTFWQNFEFIVLIFCFLTFQQFQPKLFNFLRVFFHHAAARVSQNFFGKFCQILNVHEVL